MSSIFQHLIRLFVAKAKHSTTASSMAMTVSLLHSHHVSPLEPPPRKAPLPPALLLPTPLLPALLPATTCLLYTSDAADE